MSVARLGVALALGALAGVVTSACRVPNKDHCDNQSEAGNVYCATLNAATPFCSPCHAKNHGCLPFEPTSCEAYVGSDGGDESSSGS